MRNRLDITKKELGEMSADDLRDRADWLYAQADQAERRGYKNEARRLDRLALRAFTLSIRKER